MGAFTENEKQIFTLRLALSPSQKHQLETTVTSANSFLATITESSDPLDWPVGTKDKLQSAIAEANAVLNNDASTDSDYSNTNNMKPERLHGKKNVNKERRQRFPSSLNQRT